MTAKKGRITHVGNSGAVGVGEGDEVGDWVGCEVALDVDVAVG